MILKPAGREYATYPVLETTPTEAVIQASFDNGLTWVQMERVEDTVRVLVAGPEAVDNPPGTVTLPLGTTVIQTRVEDFPEDVIRSAGFVTVTAAEY